VQPGAVVISWMREPPCRSVAAIPTLVEPGPPRRRGRFAGFSEDHGAVAWPGRVAQVQVMDAGAELGQGLPHRAGHRVGRRVVAALGQAAAQP
jgi:hypothetical protein